MIDPEELKPQKINYANMGLLHKPKQSFWSLSKFWNYKFIIYGR